MNWREVPFARLLLPFVAGIFLAIYLPWHPPMWMIITGLIIIISLLIYLNFTKNLWRLRWSYGAIASIFLIWLGWQITYLHNELNIPNHFQDKILKENTVVGTIRAIQPTSTGKARLQLRVAAISDSSSAFSATYGNLLVYLDSTALDSLDYGDHISLIGNITSIERSKNPKAFDFEKYMHFKNLHYQAFVKSGEWKLVSKANGWNAFLIADRLRDRCVAILQKHLPTNNELAVGSALILGYRDEITEEVRNAYANTGAMHVLAVSGLHVGFIYLGLSFLLGLIKSKNKHWKITKTILEILGVWAFALLTGASPSVLRAATMFSFIIAGKAIQRDANIYNTLAASAFFLLCINPYYIMDVGFQLSYLAVLGIVYFQPKIYKLIYIKYKIGDYIWKLMAVSLAAQISTLPISLYYFHQFPLYFWLSGLVVVPVAIVILCGGFLLFITDFIPGWSWLLGKTLYGIITLVNKAIFLIEQIPGNLLKGIWISFLAVLLLYFIIMAVIIAIETRRFRWVLATLGCLLLLNCSYVISQWKAHHQSLLTIYHVSKHTAIDYFDGKKLITLTDHDINKKAQTFASQNHQWYRKSDLTQSLELGDGFEVYRFGKIKIAAVNNIVKSGYNKKIPVDYVLVRDNPNESLADLLQPFDCKHIILDASNSFWNIERWRQECAEQGLLLYNVQEQGAFVLDLN